VKRQTHLTNATTPAHQANRELRKIALIAAAIILIATCATAYYFSRRTDNTPRLDAPVEQIARFVSDPEFAKLPFERQRRFMEVLDDREDELDDAYRAGKLGPRQYQRALEFGWFGKQLPRMEKYASLTTPQEQAVYVNERLDKKDGKDRKKKKGGGGGNDDGPKSVVNASADEDASPGGNPTDVKRDEQSEKDIPRTWPPEWREKWKTYRTALKERRDQREEERDQAQQDAQTTARPN
jgi:hypothetical protein